jgi:rod shape-determining protein MreC
MAAPRTSRSRSVLYVVVLCAMTLLAAQRVLQPLRGRVQDVESSLDSFGGRLASPVNKIVSKQLSYDALKKENARLAAELDKEKANRLRYEDAVRERRELLELNGFEDPEKTPFVRARIIGSPLNNVDQTIRIDKGSGAGISKDMTVVSASGLVGRVVAAWPRYADVMLVTDPQMYVGVRFGRTGEVAIAHGQSSGAPLELDLVALGADVRKGDKVYTSGLQNSRFPAEIPVGIVTQVRVGSVSQQVEIRPVVDLGRISFVQVLKRAQP